MTSSRTLRNHNAKQYLDPLDNRGRCCDVVNVRVCIRGLPDCAIAYRHPCPIRDPSHHSFSHCPGHNSTGHDSSEDNDCADRDHHCRDHVSVHTDASAYADAYAHRRKVPGGSPLEVALIEEWIIAYINEAREAQGFHSLESDPVISDIARDHSASMTAAGILSTQINGDGPTDRALAAGYDCRADLGSGRYSQRVAESIAKHPRVQRWHGRTSLGVTTWSPSEYYEDAQQAAKGIVYDWMGDPESRDVLLAEKYRRAGAGVNEEETKGWGLETFYATVNFSACR